MALHRSHNSFPSFFGPRPCPSGLSGPGFSRPVASGSSCDARTAPGRILTFPFLQLRKSLLSTHPENWVQSPITSHLELKKTHYWTAWLRSGPGIPFLLHLVLRQAFRLLVFLHRLCFLFEAAERADEAFKSRARVHDLCPVVPGRTAWRVLGGLARRIPVMPSCRQVHRR